MKLMLGKAKRSQLCPVKVRARGVQIRQRVRKLVEGYK